MNKLIVLSLAIVLLVGVHYNITKSGLDCSSQMCGRQASQA